MKPNLIDLSAKQFDLLKLAEDCCDDNFEDDNILFIAGMVIRLRSILNTMFDKPQVNPAFSSVLESYVDLYIKLQHHQKILAAQLKKKEENGLIVE